MTGREGCRRKRLEERLNDNNSIGMIMITRLLLNNDCHAMVKMKENYLPSSHSHHNASSYTIHILNLLVIRSW